MMSILLDSLDIVVFFLFQHMLLCWWKVFHSQLMDNHYKLQSLWYSLISLHNLHNNNKNSTYIFIELILSCLFMLKIEVFMNKKNSKEERKTNYCFLMNSHFNQSISIVWKRITEIEISKTSSNNTWNDDRKNWNNKHSTFLNFLDENQQNKKNEFKEEQTNWSDDDE